MKTSEPITRRQILDSSKLNEFADDNFKFDKNGRRLSKQVENTVEKEKLLVTGNFSFSNSVFKRLISQGRQKVSLCGNGLNLYQMTNFTLVQIQSICIQQNNHHLEIETCAWKGREHCGKRRKCCLPAFSPFLTIFSKAFFFRGVKSQDYVVKG